LIDYLEDVRTLLADQAYSELVDITGQDFDKETDPWKNWLSANVKNLAPKPWSAPTDAIRAWTEEVLIDLEQSS
jgi:hypothetical protein